MYAKAALSLVLAVIFFVFASSPARACEEIPALYIPEVEPAVIIRTAFNGGLKRMPDFSVHEPAPGFLNYNDELWLHAMTTLNNEACPILFPQAIPSLFFGEPTTEGGLVLELIDTRGITANGHSIAHQGFRVASPSYETAATINFTDVYIAGPVIPGVDYHAVVLVAPAERGTGVYENLPAQSVRVAISASPEIEPWIPPEPRLTLHLRMDSYNMYNAEDGSVVQTMDVLPTIVDGRVLLPVRFIACALGGSTRWHGESQTITVGFDGIQVAFRIGELYHGMDVPAQIIDGRVMLPLRTLNNLMDATLTWDGTAREVTITVN